MAVAMDAEQQEAFALLVVAVVGVEHLADLAHHVAGLHGRRCLHAPGEAQGTWFGVFLVLPLIPGHVPTARKRREKLKLTAVKRSVLCVSNLSKSNKHVW